MIGRARGWRHSRSEQLLRTRPMTELSEAPARAPSARLVSVDIKAIGICGTDFHIFEGTHPFLDYPRVMGHELSGVVADGAAGRLAPRTRVAVNPYPPRGGRLGWREGPA